MFCLLLLMDFGYTYHKCLHNDLFYTYGPVDSGVVNMGNDALCKVVGISTVQVKTHDSAIKALTKVRLVPYLNPNLVSLVPLKPKDLRI